MVDAVSYHAQLIDRTEGRFPDGDNVTQALTLPTPGGVNALTRFSGLTRTGANATLTFTTTPGLRYQVEYSDELNVWRPLGSEQIATGDSLTVTDTAASGGSRFYRARVSE